MRQRRELKYPVWAEQFEEDAGCAWGDNKLVSLDYRGHV